MVKAKSRAKTWVKSLTKGGVHVLKPSLNKRALARLKDVTSLVGVPIQNPYFGEGALPWNGEATKY